MNDRVRLLGSEARKLTPEERFELVEEIFASLGQPEPEIEAAWISEAKDRLDAWRKGELPSRPLADVLGKYEKP